jgi:hypothetical protein
MQHRSAASFGTFLFMALVLRGGPDLPGGPRPASSDTEPPHGRPPRPGTRARREALRGVGARLPGKARQAAWTGARAPALASPLPPHIFRHPLPTTDARALNRHTNPGDPSLGGTWSCRSAP